MKNFLYIGLLFSLFIVSCELEDVDVYPVEAYTDVETENETVVLGKTGTNVSFVKEETGQTKTFNVIVGLAGKPRTTPVNFTLSSAESDDLPLDAISYSTTGTIEAGKLIANVPVTVELDKLAEATPQKMSLKLVSSDGDFTNFAPVTYTLTVICPSNIATGTYTSTATGTSTDGCCPDVTTVESTVTITAVSEGNYSISDFSAGIYLEWYDVYGITPDFQTDGRLSADFGDICNNLSGTFTEPFGTASSLTGSYDPATGVITYSWITGYDDKATVVLTPQ
ncbi:hypothetical protein [Portibacter lacus]|uniref:Uncharacterized protein n=1 Tax=Portibacter lacus TaxID=1099794 RepID=A0AA37STX3_9BACT|nr:hypothetical protein [Portibacter lacus]GLR19225.1 hypothetical protein GCM10007940_38410 [Portibacter lacus]